MADEPPTSAAPADAPESSPPPGGHEGKPRGKAKKKKFDDADAQARSAGRRERGRPMRGLGRRHKANLDRIERRKRYPMSEALKLLKQVARDTKFDQTVNIVMNLGIDPKNADQMVRGSVSLPKGIGKTKRVIAFCEDNDVDKAKAAGAIEAGLDDLVKKVSDGWQDFDVAIAHPRSMGKVGRLGRVLGPQGKMPSPKSGTVTPDIETAVREFAAGKIEFRNDAGANIHGIVGKVSFSESDLEANISAFVDHIRRLKPSSSKGTYLRKVCISGSMSPAIELEMSA
jgi:large subunit ribosomal protein L1